MKQGFTLVEVLFAVAFLSLSLFAVLQVFPVAFNLERLSQTRSQAMALAQEKMEQIYSQDYFDIAPGELLEGNLDPPFNQFSRQINVEYVDGSLEARGTDTGLKKVTVIVSWESPLLWAQKQTQIFGLVANN